MSQADVDAEMPVDLPSLRSSGQLSNYTNMVALINLTLRLADIANEMYATLIGYSTWPHTDSSCLDLHCEGVERACHQTAWTDFSLKEGNCWSGGQHFRKKRTAAI
jgi:hypothetical protein